MFFRGRGLTYIAERDDLGVVGPAVAICQDALAIALATDSGEHINRCGLVDAPDLRFAKSATGTVTLTYSEVEDKKFAIGVLGTVNAAQSPGSVTNEELPDGLVNGDVYFLGGLARHRTITSLVITDSATTPATLVLDTDYTVDAVSGMVTFLDVSGHNQPYQADYGYTDPASVSLLSAGQKNYVLFFEFFNTVNANDPGSLEIYSVRFDAATNVELPVRGFAGHGIGRDDARRSDEDH